MLLPPVTSSQMTANVTMVDAYRIHADIKEYVLLLAMVPRPALGDATKQEMDHGALVGFGS